ncbi:MAG: FAD-dependent oxidoreductase [Acidobacteriaceae bacterium]
MDNKVDKKIGVYICSGCEIGEKLGVDALVRVAEKECKATVCRTHPFLCSAEGTALIRQDRESGAVNTLVIAACSPRAKTEAFSFDPCMVMERVNLREQVAWSHPAGEEETQALAEDYLRMGIAKASKMEALEPMTGEVSKAILVVGGGIAGLTAALEAANAGYQVVLVEKSDRLGGSLAEVKRPIPAKEPYTVSPDNDAQERARLVMAHPRIKVHTGATITRTEGQPGQFDVTLTASGQPVAFRVGAIVLATGWKPYDPTRLSGLGYGASPNVVTNLEMEKMAAEGRIRRPSDKKPPQRTLFIQCAGSRHHDHLPYCSSVCCMATLQQAEYIHEADPEAEVYVIYQDMMTPGPYEKLYQKVQEHPKSFFMKGEVGSVVPQPEGRVRVKVENTLFGGPFQMDVDMVVLATGMVPNAADSEAIRTLHDAQAKVLRNESEKQRTEAEAVVASLRQHENTEVLHLAYRQGPDLPVRRHGFPDSNFICFPYETQRTGIYAAGAVRSPMDWAGAEEDAAGAAMKAIQSVELASLGAAVHPRAGDLSFPSFLLQRCTQCKRCTVECPFGAIDEDEKGTPRFNPYRCRRCGVCMGACPERIISFKNYSVDMIATMIKAVEVPEDDEDKPRILLFACENDAVPSLDMAGMERTQLDASVRVVPLRCLGSMNVVWIADALSSGFDGVMLAGCKHGDDYQCHFVRGSELAERRLDNVKETLQRLQLESERIEMVEVAFDDYQRLPKLINDFAGRIRALSPNPYKGF